MEDKMKISLKDLKGLIRETVTQEMAVRTSPRTNRQMETKRFLSRHIERIWNLISAGHGTPELEAELRELESALNELYASIDGAA
jgi:hypothetical protein